MEGRFKFKKMKVWQLAMDFGEEMNLLAIRFPKNEQFNLSSQLKRASDSVALNISEGSIGQSNLEQRKFIGYSIRSLAEVVTCIHKAKRRKYITNIEFDNNYQTSYQLMNMLIAFRKSIK
jgi:four helix bundle protein